MAVPTGKSVHSLVLDAGPIIKNDPPVATLIAQAEILYTIPAVINEIRDEATRSRVQITLLPFLTERSPNSNSIKVITDFARRTGDLEVLSRPDIHLMALAYELECERNRGDWRLRSVPGQKKLNGAPPPQVTGEPTGDKIDEKFTEAKEIQPLPGFKSEPQTTADCGTVSTTEAPTSDGIEAFGASMGKHLEDMHISEKPLKTQSVEPGNLPDRPETIGEDNPVTEEIQDSEDSEGEGWITPSNLKKQQAKDDNTIEPSDEPKTMQVALVTSDFAMQNVLLRMNLNLLSSSLQRIRQLKIWVLRCHACFHITKDMSKQFCARCGKPTLMRTSCSTDKDGSFKIHLKKNMQWNTRGNVYSIPKPVAGSSNGKLVSGGGKGGWGQGLILAEDQKEYIQAMTGAQRKKERDLMDEDYLPRILTGDRGHTGGRPKVGAGKNVNSRKRR